MSKIKDNRILRLIFATPQQADDGLALRRWFAIYCIYLAGLCILSSWGFARYGSENLLWAKGVWLICLYMFYFSLACTFVPLPTSWFVLFLCSPAGGFGFVEPVWRILIVAGLGAVATGMAHLNEYHLGGYLLRLGKMRMIRQTRLYNFALKIFKTWPFMIQVVFNIIPIPADPARWIAIISHYPLRKFFLAQASGRFIRYALMGIAAELLHLTIKEIIILQAALVILPLIRLLYRWITHKRTQPVVLDT